MNEINVIEYFYSYQQSFLSAVPPDIDDLHSSSDVVANEGDDAGLTCRAHGHPTPLIQWKREDGDKFPVYDPKFNSSRRLMGETNRM